MESGGELKFVLAGARDMVSDLQRQQQTDHH